MHDGSRHFVSIPEVCSFDEFHRHIESLSCTEITGYTTDNISEMWLDFTFRGHSFSVNNQFGDFWFFVTDSECPDVILKNLIEHCESLFVP